MKLEISANHFIALAKKSISLDSIFILKLLEQNADLESLKINSAKIDIMCMTLMRKGYITEENKLTVSGIELITFVDDKHAVEIIKKKPIASEFDEWWKEYPASDIFIYKGVKFMGSRAFKVKKDDCRIQFNKIVNEGEVTALQLIAALKFDVLVKKEESIKARTNKLMYMQNSLTYLNQRTFEGFIEVIEEGQTVSISPEEVGSTDI
jgi:hypothetical protein